MLVRRRIVYPAFVLLLAGAGIEGQAPATGTRAPAATSRVIGVVTGPDGLPIPGVSIRVLNPPTHRVTEEDGRFDLGVLPRGPRTLLVEHPAFAAVERTVEVAESGVIYDLEIRLSEQVIALDPVTVEVVRLESFSDPRARMEWMERAGLGIHLDRAAIDASGASRVSHLLARFPGVQLIPAGGRIGGQQIRLSRQGGCEPSLYVNGIRTTLGGSPIDDVVSLPEVETIEVYRRITSLPAQFADDRARSCGAIVIHTRRSIQEGEPFGWKRMVFLGVFLSATYILDLLILR